MVIWTTFLLETVLASRIFFVSNGRMQFTHLYNWKSNPKRKSLFKRACRIICHGKMGSVLIEFENGQKEVVSTRALRRNNKQRVNGILDKVGN